MIGSIACSFRRRQSSSKQVRKIRIMNCTASMPRNSATRPSAKTKAPTCLPTSDRRGRDSSVSARDAAPIPPTRFVIQPTLRNRCATPPHHA